MEQELLDVIKKNLPEAAAGEMKKFIEQANQTKINLEKSEANIVGIEKIIEEKIKDIKFRDQSIANLNKSVDELNHQIDKCKDCKKRYMQLGYQEQIMDIQNQHSIARVNDAKEYLGLAFKSPVFKKEVATTKGVIVKCADSFDYSTVPAQTASGGEMIEKHTDTETTTETEE